MKKWIKYILVLIAIGIVGAVLVYIFYINKSHPDYSKLPADHMISAMELYDGYINDRLKSDQTYTGKMLHISGDLDSVEQTDSIVTVVFVFNEGMFGDEGIRCSFLPEYHSKVLNWKNNDRVSIKGYCVGFNDTDVILDKCSIPE